MKYEAKKIKLMDFTFPFEITPIVTWTIWKLQISLSCEFRVSEIIEQRQALPPDYFHLDFCAATPSIWWDGIYCLWDWWKITRVFSPSIRKSNVALMLWYGEKSDLALGSGMFLVRLWWVGPGRGHMKGSLCQAAKMFSLSLMKTRTHIQIENMHATHYTNTRATTLLTATVFFPCSLKVDKVKSMSVLWLKGSRTLKQNCHIQRQTDNIFLPPFFSFPLRLYTELDFLDSVPGKCFFTVYFGLNLLSWGCTKVQNCFYCEVLLCYQLWNNAKALQ